MTGNTIQSNTVVTGWISYYDHDKQFGFADVQGQRVFFHMSAQREVDGTPEEPTLTNRRPSDSDRQPRWFRRSRRVEYLVLRVVQGPKGLKASAWGFRPERTWLEELQHTDALSQYHSARLRMTIRNHRGTVVEHILGDLLVEPLLNPGEPWTLRLDYVRYETLYLGRDVLRGRELGHRTTTFQLTEWARPGKSSSYGITLEVPIERESGRVDDARIVITTI